MNRPARRSWGERPTLLPSGFGGGQLSWCSHRDRDRVRGWHPGGQRRSLPVALLIVANVPQYASDEANEGACPPPPFCP